MTNPAEQTLFLCRHGHRMDWVDPQWYGPEDNPHDPPLSPLGMEMAQELAQRLSSENFSRILCSPFLRVVQTAHFTAEIKNIKMGLEGGCSEWLNPQWFDKAPQPLNPIERVKKYPQIDINYESLLTPVFPEVQEQSHARNRQAIHRILEKYQEDLLVVGHGATVFFMLSILTGIPIEEVYWDPCSLSKLERYNGKWNLVLNGDITHLSAIDAPTTQWEG